MSVGFFVYILVFSKKKIQRKTQRCLQNGAKKKHTNTNVSACFLVRVVGVEQLKLMYYRQKRVINSRKSEGITQLCWLMPNSFFDI
jgi:tRNA pseudouridine-54 N-methylase